VELDISLGQDERVYREYEFSRSFIFSLLKLKSHFWLTNKRLIVSTPNTFLLVIPTGKNTHTYPLRNIASIHIQTEFDFIYLLVGVLLVLLSIPFIFFCIGLLFGLPFLLYGINYMERAFQTTIAITSSSGGVMTYPCSRKEAMNAKRMVNELNQLIADI